VDHGRAAARNDDREDEYLNLLFTMNASRQGDATLVGFSTSGGQGTRRHSFFVLSPASVRLLVPLLIETRTTAHFA
jgi:hypothetical protein